MNYYSIPQEVEAQIRSRDKKCVYCGKTFSSNATIDHVDNDTANMSPSNLVICCNVCNASKGNKKLSVWIHSVYCKNHKINNETVAPIIQEALDKGL